MIGRSKSTEPLNAVKSGIAAGAAGTAAMTAAQMAYYKATGAEPSSLPATVARRIAGGVLRRELPPPEGGVDTVLNNMMHWLYGIGWGALFGLTAAGRRPGRGILFGLVVWGASLIELPAMKLAPPIYKQDPATIAPDLAFHLLYGTATATAYRAIGSR